MLTKKYYQGIEEMLKTIVEKEEDNLNDVADAIYKSLKDGGVLHIFGSGHSEMIAREFTGRAGGLAPVNAILDKTKGKAEKIEGYAKVVLDDYEKKAGLKPGEVIIVVSNSGINPLPLEMAMEAKDRGLITVALTSLTYSKKVESRHSSGKHLCKICDYVIDNQGILGDALIEIPGCDLKAGSTSTITGAFIVNLLNLKIIKRFVDNNQKPPVYLSINLDGAEDFNDSILRKYQNRLYRD